MDLTDQRLACLRMAMELNCKTEPLLKAANELMSFIATGSAHTPAQNDAKPEVETAATEPAIDTIAACGTALQMSDVGGLEAAQPANPLAHAEALAEPPPGDSDSLTDPADVTELTASGADLAADVPANTAVEAPTDVAAEATPDERTYAEVPATDDAPAVELTDADVSTTDEDAAVETIAEAGTEAADEVRVAEANPEQPAAVH